MNSACRTANAECVNVCRCKALYYDDNPQYLGGTCQLSKSPGIACLVPSSWIAFPLTVCLNNRLMTCFNQLIIVWPNILSIINYPFVWFRFQVIVCLNHCLLVMCFNRCPNMCTYHCLSMCLNHCPSICLNHCLSMHLNHCLSMCFNYCLSMC